MKNKYSGTFTGERALFHIENALIKKSIFLDGESPLKESRNLVVDSCVFQWKYPLWYCKDVEVKNTIFEINARSGIWYTENIRMENCNIIAPKEFRRSKGITLVNCKFDNAQETLWNCEDIKLVNIKAEGDYFGMNSKNITIENLNLVGNYAFDGSKNITIKNSRLESRDSFWNCENVVVENCTIIGEYLAWNTKNITFINCKIESHQGLCYIDGLKMINCEIVNSDLCFEFCKNVDAEITSHVDSIKNPYSGKIKVKSVGELILDNNLIDLSKVDIKVEK